jgi:FkbM family methyltransferase
VVSPAYVFRPSQVVRRLGARPASGRTVVKLPWGDEMSVSLDGQLGTGLARAGVHELPSTETLWRLTGPDDLTLDIGANAGYFTSLLSVRARAVTAFEPHPGMCEALRENVARWSHQNVSVDPRALSDHSGQALLSVPQWFSFNHGTATLGETEDPLATFEVELATLDELLTEPVGVAKMDVEFHELEVLHGAERVLSSHVIRDLVFEDTDAANSPVFECLRDHGYEIFGLAQALLGVSLVDPLSPRAIPQWDAPNYLATAGPERAHALMRRPGWHSLRSGLIRRISSS